jgi:hypothetical protein
MSRRSNIMVRLVQEFIVAPNEERDLNVSSVPARTPRRGEHEDGIRGREPCASTTA